VDGVSGSGGTGFSSCAFAEAARTKSTARKAKAGNLEEHTTRKIGRKVLRDWYSISARHYKASEAKTTNYLDAP
jgi:hypothetical protein